MNFHILTLFPDMVLDGLHTSIIGRAVENGLISIEAIDIREYSTDKHRHVDDYPYGGGAGMVMQPMPICDAYDDLCDRIGKKPRVIYLTPQGMSSARRSQKSWRLRRNWYFCAAITRAWMSALWSWWPRITCPSVTTF